MGKSRAAVLAYTPGANDIRQTVSLSLNSRGIAPVVHLVQYDKTLPVVAVELTANGSAYTVPEDAAVNVRERKPDGTTVYDPVLGLSEDRRTAYIGITQQMTAAAGSADVILEVSTADGVAGSAPLEFVIDRNPVSEDAVESTDEFATVGELLAKAQDAAERAEQAQTSAQGILDSVQELGDTIQSAGADTLAEVEGAIANLETAVANAKTAETDLNNSIEEAKQALRDELAKAGNPLVLRGLVTGGNMTDTAEGVYTIDSSMSSTLEYRELAPGIMFIIKTADAGGGAGLFEYVISTHGIYSRTKLDDHEGWFGWTTVAGAALGTIMADEEESDEGVAR